MKQACPLCGTPNAFIKLLTYWTCEECMPRPADLKVLARLLSYKKGRVIQWEQVNGRK